MTNQPKGNYIISHDVFSSGKVVRTFPIPFATYAHAHDQLFSRGTYAGGRGARVQGLQKNEPNPLFAQGSIQVSDKHLFVVNVSYPLKELLASVSHLAGWIRYHCHV